MAKNLLTESEFKKFMKLARLEPLSSNKLSEMYGEGRGGMSPAMRDDKPGEKDEKDEKDEEDESLEEELSALFEEEDEMPMDMDMEAGGEEDEDVPPVEDEEMPDVELDDEEGMGDEEMGGDVDNSEIESALTSLLDLIDQKLDAAGAGEMMDVETEDEPEGDEGMGGIEGGDAEMDAAPPAPEGGMDDEELMETVARRVARRLQRESKVDAKSDLIAERIMKRLKNL
jgi:hypothetical protein